MKSCFLVLLRPLVCTPQRWTSVAGYLGWLALVLVPVLLVPLQGARAQDPAAQPRPSSQQDSPETDRSSETTALLMPFGGSEALIEQYREITLPLLQSQLQADALQPRRWEDWRRQAPAELRHCTTPDCSGPLLEALGAQVAVFVALWEDGEETTVEVFFQERAGRLSGGASFRNEADLPAALAQAFASIRVRRRAGSGPYLEVRGTPEGAQVLVDETPEGTLPYFAAVTPGEHVVTVRLHGYESIDRRVVVPSVPSHTAVLEVALDDRTMGRDTELLGDDAASLHWVHYLGPAVLAAGGTGALVVGLTSLGVDEVRDSGTDGPILRRTNDTHVAIWIGAGGAALAAAVTWFVVAQASDDPSDAGARDSERALKLMPVVGPTGAGLRVAGAF